MSTDNIADMNEAIALFMGYYKQQGKFYPKSGSENRWFKDAKYHWSFDAIIPVVEKIERMDFGFKLCRKRVEVYRDSNKEIILDIKKGSRIESLHQAVYDFILWHNSNSQNNQP